jgi:hypothetical protein
MENKNITEEQIKEVLSKILNEEKVSRDQYTKVRFKLEDLSQSLNETIKELRKVQDSLPLKLKGSIGGKLSTLDSSFSSAQKTISILKEKVRQLKRSEYAQQVVEKKK